MGRGDSDEAITGAAFVPKKRCQQRRKRTRRQRYCTPGLAGPTPLERGVENLVHHRHGLLIVPEYVVPPPEGPVAAEDRASSSLSPICTSAPLCTAPRSLALSCSTSGSNRRPCTYENYPPTTTTPRTPSASRPSRARRARLGVEVMVIREEVPCEMCRSTSLWTMGPTMRSIVWHAQPRRMASTATAPAPAAGPPVGSAATSGRAGEWHVTSVGGAGCATPGRGVRAGRRRRRPPPPWPRTGELCGATGRNWARRRRRTTARRHLSKPRESCEVRSGGMRGRVGVEHGTTDARSRWTRTTPATMTSRATERRRDRRRDRRARTRHGL